MTDKQTIEQEALSTYHKLVEMRDEIDAGRRQWADLADLFTEDAVYLDPAWGRQEGREAIRDFFTRSMAGLTGHGWSTPERWIMVDGHRVVSKWDQVMGEKENGGQWIVPGVSILYPCSGSPLLNSTCPRASRTGTPPCLKNGLIWNSPSNNTVNHSFRPLAVSSDNVLY
jgi:hypothetical protein